MNLPCFYSPKYTSTEAATLAELATAADRISTIPGVDLQTPKPIEIDLLQGLHSDNYLHDFLEGREPLASSQGIKWSPNIRDAVLAMLGGQLEGAEAAFQHGIAMNIARGFHHAVYERGSGYCAINGLALIAHRYPHKRIAVLDCDEHGGNGTEEFTARLPNLFNISIFGTRFGCRGSARSWALKVLAQEAGFDIYISALRAAEDLISDLNPDILLYQAGTDCHHEDPKNRSGLTTEELYLRDQFVFTLARQRRIPILFIVAGGYQSPENIAKLNVNTVHAALSVFCGAESVSTADFYTLFTKQKITTP